MLTFDEWLEVHQQITDYTKYTAQCVLDGDEPLEEYEWEEHEYENYLSDQHCQAYDKYIDDNLLE